MLIRKTIEKSRSPLKKTVVSCYTAYGAKLRIKRLIFMPEIFATFRPARARFFSSSRGRSRIGAPAAVLGILRRPPLGRSGRDDRHKMAGAQRRTGRGGDGEVAHGRRAVGRDCVGFTAARHQPGPEGEAKALHGSP